LDCFAGSGTTGHAVVEANAADGGERRYILVQLPEPLERDDFPTIAALTRERMRKVGDEVSATPPLAGPTDIGFRSYRLQASNFNVWDAQISNAGEVEEQLLMAVEHIGSQATDDAILAELLLKAGYPLTSPTEKVAFAGVSGYSVAEGALLVCLSRELTIEVFEAMVALEPAMILVLDTGFGGNDELKVNALQTVRARNHQTGSDIALRVV
jgi:adenine-specific DNA-methyltransferase